MHIQILMSILKYFLKVIYLMSIRLLLFLGYVVITFAGKSFQSLIFMFRDEFFVTPRFDFKRRDAFTKCLKT